MSEGNASQNHEGSNGSANPTLPSSGDSTSPQDGRPPSRSVTVSIQYSYLTPNGLTNLAFPNATPLPTNVPGGPDLAGNVDPDPSTLVRPDGALVLSFSDVPTATPQERLESIVSIAAELAMRRFGDLVSQSKGITKEQFENLPVINVRDLPDYNSVCSICYENYEDESTNILKRGRDGDLEGNSIKKQKSESPAINIDRQQDNGTDGGSEAHPSSSTDTATPNEEEPPTYKHYPVKLPCGHIFGRECLYKWSRLENSCPLCRKPIVEPTPEERRDTNASGANSSAEVFERIRQLVYSPPTQEQSGDSEQSQTPNDTNSTGSNPPQATEAQPFTFSRSGIVFLRPNPHEASATAANNEVTSVTSSTPSNSNVNEHHPTENDNISTQMQNDSANLRPGARRIQWIPIPITTIRMGNENNENNTSENDNNHAAHGERLRAILDRVFSVTHAENTLNQHVTPSTNTGDTSQGTGSNESNPGSTNASANSTPLSAASEAPRRRSFLQNILRITNRSRNRPSSDTTQANGNEGSAARAPAPNTSANINDMFSTGVASYRNPDGHVSTFNVDHGPLPIPPQNNRSGNSSNSNNNDNQRASNMTRPPNSDSTEEDTH